MYKSIRIGIFGLPDFKYYKHQSLANSCSRLAMKGYIKRGNKGVGDYFITTKGVEYLEEGSDELETFSSCNNKNLPKNLMVIYDIPQGRRKERDWFRGHLKKFHFIMIQKSVWVGPSPLPKEFIEYVKEIELGDNFKTFKLERGYGQK